MSCNTYPGVSQLVYNFFYTAFTFVVAMTIRDALLHTLNYLPIYSKNALLAKWSLSAVSVIFCVIFISLTYNMGGLHPSTW